MMNRSGVLNWLKKEHFLGLSGIELLILMIVVILICVVVPYRLAKVNNALLSDEERNKRIERLEKEIENWQEILEEVDNKEKETVSQLITYKKDIRDKWKEYKKITEFEIDEMQSYDSGVIFFLLWKKLKKTEQEGANDEQN
jgi:predicted O-linked N-acetylglucosamine transferase (SPINDLY family)